MILNKNVALENKRWQDKTLQLAFDELKSLWIKRFGCPVKTRQHVEIDIRFDLNPASKGFSVIAGSDNLTFHAPTAVEILYAVYDFAEEFLGFCFFEPGVDRVDKKNAVVELKEDVLIANRRPLLINRGFIQEFPFSEDSYQIGDWMAKNKLNYLMTWMKFYDEMPEAMKEFYQIRGIEIESGHHNFNYWIPPEKYYRSRPDFFAVIDGRRISPSTDKSALLLSEQLCTANPELRAEIVKNMAAYCRKHPEVKTISLIPNDGFGWCECERCSTFYDKNAMGGFYSVSAHVSKAGRIYHDMVRDVVTQLARLLPEINVTFCAYVNYCAPSEGFKLGKNMAVHFAPYWRCINHRINDKNCGTNSYYEADLKKWLSAKAGGKVNIYEYYMGVNLYVSLPMVHHEDIFDEISWYGEQGVDGVLTQFHLSHWTVYGLNYCMMAKAAYGADKKYAVESVLRGIFREDWKVAERFYTAMKKLVLSAGNCHIPYPYSLFSRTSIKQYRKIHVLAQELLTLSTGDKFRKALVLWAEYLLKFKELFDRYQNERIQIKDVEGFQQWLQRLPPSRILVLPKTDMLLGAWIECLKTGREWLHFNLDWEDNYIRKHRESLN